MREIKFRAWYIPENRFIEWSGMHGIVREIGDNVAIHIAAGDQCFAFSDEITLEQYTGLKDKNGREIYEGDIFKDEFGKAGAIVYTSEDVGSCGCCYQDFEGIGFKAPSVRINSKGEVVGNVHVHDATKGAE